jgi:hypothetical protein
MAFFSLDSFLPHRQSPMERQLAHLRHELASVSGAVQHLAAPIGHRAAEAGDRLLQQGSVVAHQVGRQALRAGKAVKKDPVPAAVGLITAALLANLFAGHK